MKIAAEQINTDPNAPVDTTSLAEIRAELHQISGTPWRGPWDRERRMALWRRLDVLVKEQQQKERAK
jgi:hypothetical protein